jgi:hypothetical protein
LGPIGTGTIPAYSREAEGETGMYHIFYIVGVIVVVFAIIGYL